MRSLVVYRTCRPWLWPLVLALSACASSPPCRTETPAIRQIREEYLRVYPQGRYNDRIARSEIVKGMSLYEVLASWGIPDERSVSKRRDRELWSYVLLDDNAVDWLRYEFEFVGNELVGWDLSRNVAIGDPLDAQQTDVPPTPLPEWARGAPGPPSRTR